MLTETFGSKKKQRQQATKEANAIDRSTIYAAGVIQRQLKRDGEAVVAETEGKAPTDTGAEAWITRLACITCTHNQCLCPQRFAWKGRAGPAPEAA
jgi:hypothetical protein